MQLPANFISLHLMKKVSCASITFDFSSFSEIPRMIILKQNHPLIRMTQNKAWCDKTWQHLWEQNYLFINIRQAHRCLIPCTLLQEKKKTKTFSPILATCMHTHINTQTHEHTHTQIHIHIFIITPVGGLVYVEQVFYIQAKIYTFILRMLVWIPPPFIHKHTSPLNSFCRLPWAEK